MESRLNSPPAGRALLVATLAMMLVLPLPAHAQLSDDLIVGDLSESLKGFALQAPKEMETLYRVLFTSSPSAHLARMPGERDVVQLIGRERVRLFADAGAYNGRTTPLAETIRLSTASYPSVSIVTDAMESDNLYLQMQEAIVELTQKGWGVWVLLLPLPFDGKYDLEQPLNAQEQQAEMEDCVRQANSSWGVTINPAARRTINFRGERPLLIFVFNQSPEGGREYVLRVADGISNNLKRNPNVVELAPLQLREYSVGAGEARTVGATLVDEGGGVRKIVADPDDGGANKEIVMRVAWKRPAGQIPQPFAEEWVLDRTREAFWGDVQIEGGDNNSPGALRLGLTSELTWGEWFGQIISSGPVLREEPLQFDVSSIVEQPVPGWWDGWNEETSWRCPHKVFKLKSLVDRVSGAARERILSNPPHEKYTLKLQIGVS